MIEDIIDMYLEMSELADEIHEKVKGLEGFCEERDIRPELENIQLYVHEIRGILADMEFPLIDLEQAFEGDEE